MIMQLLEKFLGVDNIKQAIAWTATVGLAIAMGFGSFFGTRYNEMKENQRNLIQIELNEKVDTLVQAQKDYEATHSVRPEDVKKTVETYLTVKPSDVQESVENLEKLVMEYLAVKPGEVKVEVGELRKQVTALTEMTKVLVEREAKKQENLE